jgi:hypothetical protein
MARPLPFCPERPCFAFRAATTTAYLLRRWAGWQQTLDSSPTWITEACRDYRRR